MSNLTQRQQKFQEARKDTPWREFLKDIWSWFPFLLFKDGKNVSRFHPGNERVWPVVDYATYIDLKEQRSKEITEASFFEQLWEVLRHATIAGSKVIGESINSTYNDIILWAKNAYLNFVVLESENVMYSYAVNACTNVYSCLQVLKSESIYQSRAVTESQKIFYSSSIQTSNNIWFCANMVWCSECLFCDGLENQSYCINNEQLDKQTYETMKKQLLDKRELFDDWFGLVLAKPWANVWDDIHGTFNRQCSDIENWFMNFQVTKGRNVVFGSGTALSENIVDCFSFGWTSATDCYATMGVWWNASHIYGSVETSPNVYNCFYCYLVDSCSYCVWCVWLRNKEYCIFNKQYDKDEWFEKVDELFHAMEKDWTFGQSIPGKLNPFYFNDTAGSFIDTTFSKDEVAQDGYQWREDPIIVDIPEWMETVDAVSAEEWRLDVQEVILKDISNNIYRIMPLELAFLNKHHLPLPQLHRHMRLKQLFSWAKNI